MGEATPPESLRTARLLLRGWIPEDAKQLKEAIDESIAELLPWIPFAQEEPTTLDQLRARLDGYREDLLAGRHALYAIFDAAGQRLLGGIGLYRRVGPGALEIGYWIRTTEAGKGLTTEAARALTDVGLAIDGVERVEMRLDPANRASAAIPKKLGYRPRETIRAEEGEVLRTTMIWEIRLSEPPAAPSHDCWR